MAAARGTPGASLVTLVTASLRDARPGGGRGEEEREAVSYTHLTLPTTPYV